jgi:hypothetical protein
VEIESLVSPFDQWAMDLASRFRALYDFELSDLDIDLHDLFEQGWDIDEALGVIELVM